MDPRPGREVTAQYAHALLQAAQETGIALDDSLVARLRAAERVPLAWQDELWEEYCAGAGDPLAGLRLGLRMQVGHLDSAGMLLVTCATLGEALEELTAYAPVIGPGAFTLHRDGPLVRVEFEHDFGVRPLERTEAALTTLLHLARWATGGHVAPVALELAHAAPGPDPAHAAVLGLPVRFGAAGHALVLEAAQLDLPLVQNELSLSKFLRDSLAQLFDGNVHNVGLPAQIRAIISNEYGNHFPDFGEICEKLGMTPQTLRRRLKEGNTSYQEIKDSIRKDASVYYLSKPELSIDEIALLMGFSEASSFHRAFKKWTGQTPSAYRRDHFGNPHGDIHEPR